MESERLRRAADHEGADAPTDLFAGTADRGVEIGDAAGGEPFRQGRGLNGIAGGGVDDAGRRAGGAQDALLSFDHVADDICGHEREDDPVAAGRHLGGSIDRRAATSRENRVLRRVDIAADDAVAARNQQFRESRSHQPKTDDADGFRHVLALHAARRSAVSVPS